MTGHDHPAVRAVRATAESDVGNGASEQAGLYQINAMVGWASQLCVHGSRKWLLPSQPSPLNSGLDAEPEQLAGAFERRPAND